MVLLASIPLQLRTIRRELKWRHRGNCDFTSNILGVKNPLIFVTLSLHCFHRIGPDLRSCCHYREPEWQPAYITQGVPSLTTFALAYGGSRFPPKRRQGPHWQTVQQLQHMINIFLYEPIFSTVAYIFAYKNQINLTHLKINSERQIDKMTELWPSGFMFVFKNNVNFYG